MGAGENAAAYSEEQVGIEPAKVETAETELDTAKGQLDDWILQNEDTASGVQEGWDAEAATTFRESFNVIKEKMTTMPQCVEGFKLWAQGAVEEYNRLNSYTTDAMSDL